MCGISGHLDPRSDLDTGALGEIARAMSDSLRHRGPDDAGIWVDPEAGLALGHRRLAILDPTAAGHQPMLSPCGRFVVVFNGEIYNFRSLREELAGRGHRFRGGSDTEVLLAAVREWGVSRAVERFNGMFAFALWDRQERRLWLARDPIGIKPLYYGRAGRALVFASELKALRAHPSFCAEIDRDALAAYLRHSYVPGPRSIYRGVWKLPPGTLLALDGSAPSDGAEPTPFWSPLEAVLAARSDPFRGSEEDAIDALDELLRDAVRLQMESDVPLGAFLSGGVDSSLVTALMQAQSSAPVRTFTAAFREPAYDESRYARAVAEHLGTAHTEFRVEPAHALEVVPQLAELYDEPFADSSQLPTQWLAAVTRRHVTVCLSGDGGDELFAGYDRYFWVDWLWRRIGWLPKRTREALAAALRAVPAPLYDSLGRLLPPRFRARFLGDKVARFAPLLSVPGPDEANRRLVSHWEDPERLVPGAEEPAALRSEASLAELVPGFVERMQLLDFLTYLPDDLLVKLDRAGMAVSLEPRVPLLDRRVVEFVWRLPFHLKVRRGERKWLLRRVLERYVPRRLTDRPKMGFGVPLDAWLRGPLREWAEELLSPERLSAGGLLDPEPIRRRWAQHASGRANWGYPLWTVLVFQAWRERWA